MPPTDLRFGGGGSDSAILPLMALCLLIASALILSLPRNKAITPFMAAFFFVPAGQVVVLAGLHFTALRILVLIALAKRAGFSKREKYPGGFNRIDRAVALWAITAVIAFFLEFPNTSAVVQGLGILVDTYGGYLAARFLIADGQTMRRAIKTLAVICVIQGIPMLGEQLTGKNIFGYFTGMRVAATVRDGHIRASGTMGALTAGPFAGVLIPLFLWIRKQPKSKTAGWVGLFGATAMVFGSNSSTSWMAMGGALIGLAFWPLRKKMRQVRLAFVSILVALHLKMKAPVWALIGRIDFTGSSSSYQRYILVDMTIKRFNTWWLIGTPDYVNWGWDSYDLCNQFVAVALTGGIVPLYFYVTIMIRSFSAIGTARKAISGDRAKEWLLWCFGADLFGTIVAHWGINYVGVLLMSLFIMFSFISVATHEVQQATPRSVKRPAREQIATPAGAPEGVLCLNS
jgi:hypothetical protein